MRTLWSVNNRYALLHEEAPIRASVAISENIPSIELSVKIRGKNKSAEVTAIVDSGATGNVISRQLVRKYNIRELPTIDKLDLVNANGSKSIISTMVRLWVTITNGIEDHTEMLSFYVGDIASYSILLGMPWLMKHNPTIDWESLSITFNRCPDTCVKKGDMIVRSEQPESDDQEQFDEFDNTIDSLKLAEVLVVRSLTKGLEPSKIGPMKTSNTSQKLAQAAQKEKRTKEEIVPARYHQYMGIFDEEKSNRFPPSRQWDHAIDLKEDYKPMNCKIYPLSPLEKEALQEWIREQLSKGYIRESKSPQASPFFFVGKKDGKLRPVQDYRILNSQTVKNTYPLPLISETIDKLRGAKYYTKMDVRWGYNNIRIKEGDEWKAAFKTEKGLFEPTVMFFGLCNSPATFQSMMNHIFRDLIDQGVVVVYMDDILIFTRDLEQHRKITEQVLQILQEHDLYLKPEKCEFEVTSIEYLGLVIGHNSVQMDKVKVKGVLEWPTPTKVKEVQAFLGFANFYRRFIKDFSKKARPLTQLTRKDIDWEWGNEAQTAFDEIKNAFISAPILVMPDPSKPMRIETDASDYAWGSVLSQLEEDGLWHPTSYISKSLTEVERNYDVHDKELRAVIGSFEAFRHYVEGAKHTVEVYTDHKNLEYFKKSQKLSRRQARWSEFLQRFDYVLIHKPGVLNKADGLSRRIDHKGEVKMDNLDQVVIKGDKFFDPMRATRRMKASDDPIIARSIKLRTAQAVELLGDEDLKREIKESIEFDDEVSVAIDAIKESGPRSLTKGLQDWNYEEGLILFRGKVYVPKNIELRRKVVQSCHDPLVWGHPGRTATMEIVSRNYWWPGMTIFIKAYVDGCAVCQQTKIDTHPTIVPIQPTQIPQRPFQYLTMDFIVKLPVSDGYDSILMITDQFTKAIVTIPCVEKINAAQTADLLIKRVFCIYGIPDKIISDRGPQFASQCMKAILGSLGIQSALSTAYHPQTDGATERANQEAEQFIRAYTNKMQDNWSTILPLADLTHNSKIHSATKRAPMELLFGYLPEWPGHVKIGDRLPAASDRIEAMNQARSEASAAMIIAQEAMKIQQDRYGSEAPSWKIGDQVWLNVKNLKTQYPSAKLAPKREGPFEIIGKVGSASYALELPEKWRIHNVFHASLLKPYIENEEHGPNWTKPPPDLIDDEEEYEIDEIMGCRKIQGNWEYYVSWKGYPSTENGWRPIENFEHAQETLIKWHKKNPKKPKPPQIKLKFAKIEARRIISQLLGYGLQLREQNKAHDKEVESTTALLRSAIKEREGQIKEQAKSRTIGVQEITQAEQSRTPTTPENKRIMRIIAQQTARHKNIERNWRDRPNQHTNNRKPNHPTIPSPSQNVCLLPSRY